MKSTKLITILAYNNEVFSLSLAKLQSSWQYEKMCKGFHTPMFTVKKIWAFCRGVCSDYGLTGFDTVQIIAASSSEAMVFTKKTI